MNSNQKPFHMKLVQRKTIIALFTVMLLSVFAAPHSYAAECDSDGDGFIVIPTQVMRNIAPDTPYIDNGNYNALQWNTYLSLYKGAQLTEDEMCDGLNFKKGAEAKRCDAVTIQANSNVYDPSKVTATLSGNQIYPGALDTPDNGIDEDCDGKDATLISQSDTKDLGGLADKAIGLLSKLVVAISILIMIWGGVLYATAAGDESKTSKARKAIIGAVIGLAVGLLAPAIVTWIAANLV